MSKVEASNPLKKPLNKTNPIYKNLFEKISNQDSKGTNKSSSDHKRNKSDIEIMQQQSSAKGLVESFGDVDNSMLSNRRPINSDDNISIRSYTRKPSLLNISTQFRQDAIQEIETTKNVGKSALELLEKDKYAEIDELNVAFETKKDVFVIFITILYQGILGAQVFLLQLATLLLINTFVAHLPDENKIDELSSVTIGISFVGILAGVCWGINAGFNVIATKHIAAKKYSKLAIYIKRQIKLVAIYSLCFIAFIGLQYWICGYIYYQPEKILTVRYLRTFFLAVTPGIIVVFFVDIQRNVHLGTGNFISAFVCEIFNFIFTVTACWFLGFYLEWGFCGILWSICIGQGLGQCVYMLNYTFNPGFKLIPSIMKCKKFTDILALNETEENINQSLAEKQDQEEQSKFDNLKYFLKFEGQFCIMFTLESGWIRLDNIAASMKLDNSWISALGQLYIVVSMIDCFSFGYGFATTTQMTSLLQKGQVYRAKIVAWLSLLNCVLISIVLCLIIGLFKHQITDILIPIAGTNHSAVVQLETESAHEKLQILFDVYLWVIPSECILGGFVAYIRALNQQKVFIYCQQVVLYCFHIFVLYMALYMTPMKGAGLIANLGLTYMVMILVCVILVSFVVDWKQQSLNFRNDISRKQAILGELNTSQEILQSATKTQELIKKDSIIYELPKEDTSDKRDSGFNDYD